MSCLRKEQITERSYEQMLDYCYSQDDIIDKAEEVAVAVYHVDYDDTTELERTVDQVVAEAIDDVCVNIETEDLPLHEKDCEDYHREILDALDMIIENMWEQFYLS